ncbi:methyltransferase domain-containing protein [Marinobacter salinisoli]|uniref:Methyltransferase domain-containing protein n=1 Tax=Marinobacter salinisoli TaxID=2769486 RepID=A0ABX7MS46_9GAMM|nr:methyltransferase domain-containing protein [Marinobacter salinisoli]QSP95182.1 methyltransferase domain-containing protein [Marinobacter salinisoli]
MTDLRLRYQTVEFGKTDIHLCTLRNTNEFHDPHGRANALGICSASWPIFGVIWPSSLILAHFISEYDTASKRVLEVGCGMALSSLLLNKKNTDITATDYHPEVKSFLERNALLNGDKSISYERTDWSDNKDNLGRFDLIIGSDLLYEDDHIELLANFIERHSKPICEIIIVDPGRGRKNKLSAKLREFGFGVSQFKPLNTDFLEQEFKGHILKYER